MSEVDVTAIIIGVAIGREVGQENAVPHCCDHGLVLPWHRWFRLADLCDSRRNGRIVPEVLRNN